MGGMASEPDPIELGVWGRASRLGHVRSRSEAMLFPMTPTPMFEEDDDDDDVNGAVAPGDGDLGMSGGSGGSLLRELPFCADDDAFGMPLPVSDGSRDFGGDTFMPHAASSAPAHAQGVFDAARPQRHTADAPAHAATHHSAADHRHLPPLLCHPFQGGPPLHMTGVEGKVPHASGLFVQATIKPIRPRNRAVAAVAEVRAAAAAAGTAATDADSREGAAADGYSTEEDSLLKEAAPRGQHYPRDPSLVLDAKKAKRILANRKSAQKSRQKKLQFIDELEMEVQKAKADRDAARAMLKSAEARALAAEHEARALRKQLDDLLLLGDNRSHGGERDGPPHGIQSRSPIGEDRSIYPVDPSDHAADESRGAFLSFSDHEADASLLPDILF